MSRVWFKSKRYPDMKRVYIKEALYKEEKKKS